jgi:hypothetical protein
VRSAGGHGPLRRGGSRLARPAAAARLGGRRGEGVAGLLHSMRRAGGLEPTRETKVALPRPRPCQALADRRCPPRRGCRRDLEGEAQGVAVAQEGRGVGAAMRAAAAADDRAPVLRLRPVIWRGSSGSSEVSAAMSRAWPPAMPEAPAAWASRAIRRTWRRGSTPFSGAARISKAMVWSASPGEDGGGLVPPDVDGRLAAAQVVVVHAGQVVVHEAVGVDAFDGRRRADRRGLGRVEERRGLHGEESAQPFATREHGVAHGGAERARPRGAGGPPASPPCGSRAGSAARGTVAGRRPSVRRGRPAWR